MLDGQSDEDLSKEAPPQKGLRIRTDVLGQQLDQLCRSSDKLVATLYTILERIEKKQAELSVKIEEYKERITDNPDDPNLQRDLRYLVVKSNWMAQDSDKIQAEKRMYQAELVMEEDLLEAHKRLQQSYEANIKISKEEIIRAESTLALVDRYLNGELIDVRKESIESGLIKRPKISTASGDLTKYFGLNLNQIINTEVN